MCLSLAEPPSNSPQDSPGPREGLRCRWTQASCPDGGRAPWCPLQGSSIPGGGRGEGCTLLGSREWGAFRPGSWSHQCLCIGPAPSPLILRWAEEGEEGQGGRGVRHVWSQALSPGPGCSVTGLTPPCYAGWTHGFLPALWGKKIRDSNLFKKNVYSPFSHTFPSSGLATLTHVSPTCPS